MQALCKPKDADAAGVGALVIRNDSGTQLRERGTQTLEAGAGLHVNLPYDWYTQTFSNYAANWAPSDKNMDWVIQSDVSDRQYLYSGLGTIDALVTDGNHVARIFAVIRFNGGNGGDGSCAVTAQVVPSS